MFNSFMEILKQNFVCLYAYKDSMNARIDLFNWYKIVDNTIDIKVIEDFTLLNIVVEYYNNIVAEKNLHIAKPDFVDLNNFQFVSKSETGKEKEENENIILKKNESTINKSLPQFNYYQENQKKNRKDFFPK